MYVALLEADYVPHHASIFARLEELLLKKLVAVLPGLILLVNFWEGISAGELLSKNVPM